MIDLVGVVFERKNGYCDLSRRLGFLVSAHILKGKKLICYHIIKDDVINAGGNYVDQPVVKDGNLITFRQPNDLPKFYETIITSL
ncbi:DJ-1/PfpI family protein [Coxiella-like endosymbiont]|uniref:DJ-1/PfpI family protein n=1 Tax=Coxiella-like endosymbiont TaxID=1592897 RepID=UPI00272C4A39|nr:DJ-1/PfpI family protein [Coxiella-like endosymbiont]